MTLPVGLRALNSRWIRYFLAVNTVSQIGYWAQLLVTSWLVHKLSGSTWMMGLAAFALNIPFLVVSPFAGVWVERVPARVVLVFTNILSGLQIASMLALLKFGGLGVWHIVLGNFIQGSINTFDAPARQAVLAEIIRRPEDLPNAIALHSGTINGARFLGPVVGGAFVAGLGEVGAFASNLVLRLPALVILLWIPIDRIAKIPKNVTWYKEFVAGIRFAFGFLPSQRVLLLLVACSFSAQAYPPLLPWIATNQLVGSAGTLSLLMAAGGLGAIFAIGWLANCCEVAGLFLSIGWASLFAGLGLVVLTFCWSIWMALPILFLIALGVAFTAAAANTVLQTSAPEIMRGRIYSIYTMCFLGLSPFGSLTAGWMADAFSPSAALVFCGSITAVSAVLYLFGLNQVKDLLD